MSLASSLRYLSVQHLKTFLRRHLCSVWVKSISPPMHFPEREDLRQIREVEKESQEKTYPGLNKCFN